MKAATCFYQEIPSIGLVIQNFTVNQTCQVLPMLPTILDHHNPLSERQASLPSVNPLGFG